MIDMKPTKPELPVQPIPLDQYPRPPAQPAEPKIIPPAIASPTVEPDPYASVRGAPMIERQIDALCNKLLSLGVTRDEIAAILTAASEPYVGPSDGP